LSIIQRYRVNQQITAPQVRLIDEKGAQIGIVSFEEAKKLAIERQLDLVEVQPNANPPVVKIIDYAKFLYQLKKERKNKIRPIKIKVIRFSVRIASHDLDVKANQADKFLSKGYKVQIYLTLHGREKEHIDLAKEKLQDFLKRIKVGYIIETPPKKNPGGIIILIRPDNVKNK